MADELSKRDAEIEALKRRLDSLTSSDDVSQETKPASAETVNAFDTFTDDDIKTWLSEGGIVVDGRWARARLITEAETVLEKQGKAKQAA
jgi:hypothetical protein